MTPRTRRARRSSALTGGVNGTTQTWVNPHPEKNKALIMLGTPSLGMVRIEWHNALSGAVVPPNWGLVRSTPVGYPVADAQNMIADAVLRQGHHAMLFIEDDTMPPLDAFLKFDAWLWRMDRKRAAPVVSGVYHIKGSEETRHGRGGHTELLGPEPLIYQGPGERAYREFEYGDHVQCWGVPTGALMVHRSILDAWAKEEDVESYAVPGYEFPIKRIFQQPSRVWVENGAVHATSGTTDLYWSSETIRRNIFEKAGWGKFARKDKRMRPFVVDTSIRFGHIDRMTGAITMGPANGRRADRGMKIR